ncbi:MAG TPA: heparan-alpha-glucosaminide N-acetyltransferase domain-containing protein [Pyrinomonadaceae bacterium]|nr:heparan-alpha-glucosaminide N-acetyltransferase domain-containing protein [Pyrinomonadaceae bacterium]
MSRDTATAVTTDAAPHETTRAAASGGAAQPGGSAESRTRLDSVDLLRGLVMVVMALDHVRDFLHYATPLFDPTDLSRAGPALFLTRWVTHFCAPVFVFLAGTGAFLSGARGKTRGELSRFLLTRGLWLVLLELTVIRLAWTFDPTYRITPLQVIWAIGWSMVALSALVRLPAWAVATFGVAVVALHNLLDPVPAESFGPLGWLWSLLHTGEPLEPLPGRLFIPLYPLLPWVGVMAAGYGFGRVLLLERERRRRLLLRLGVGLTLAFVVLRALNFYGDPRPWAFQESGLFTLFSFVNTQKYPPSLLFLLMTLGPAIIALRLFDRGAGPLSRLLVNFGRAPLFYYVLHLYLIQILAIVFAIARYGPRVKEAFAGGHLPPDYGYGLWVVYTVWIGVVVALYFPTRWFARLKRRRREAWLSYL